MTDDTSSALQYELVIARMLKTKLTCDEGTSPEIRHRQLFKGASGQQYQIDLSFETTVAGTKLLVLLECKCYKRLVGLDDVTEFAYKLRDIGAHKGIFVTTAGFQRGAATIAAREGIALVRAVKTWIVRLYSLSGREPRYVIWRDNFRVMTLKDVKSESDMIVLPPQRFETGPVDETTDALQVQFLPELEGFMGDPFNVLEAGAVFLKESGQPYSLLKDIHDRMAEYRVESEYRPDNTADRADGKRRRRSSA